MLKTRILTSLTLIPVLLASIFLLPSLYWALLMLLVIALGAWEWANMAGFSPAQRKLYCLVSVLLGLILCFFTLDGEHEVYPVIFAGLLVGTLFWLFAAPVWLTTRYYVKSAWVMVVAGWLILVPAWLALIVLHMLNPWLLLGVLVAVWIADSAAYFSGRRFGKHKLAPHISPGKTWEGVFGALLAVSLYGIGISALLPLSLWMSCIFVVGLWVITAFSIIGDLIESLIKRQAGVKDSGHLLPGHGGVLDRIDGLTSSLPIAALVINIIYWFHLYDGYPLKG